jgi:hypothetical protein
MMGIAMIAMLGVEASLCRGQHRQEDVSTLQYFSEDYDAARSRFLDAARAAGASIESYKHPHSGPMGQPLYTDVALIGPKNAEHILVLGSGTHGVEGFAGSGIQTGLLSDGTFTEMKAKTSVLLVHAINPYGFAHLRRWNEDNVDLNRNFVDHSNPYPRNLGYEQLQGEIDPTSVSFFGNVRACFRFAYYGLKNGKNFLHEAISGGQYTNPRGIFFGGQCETWSNKTLQRIAERYLCHAKRVVIVDFHTGLGRYGHAEVILNEEKRSTAYQRAEDWWGDRVKTTASGESVSVHLQGSVKLAIGKMLPKTEVTAVSLEFGTLSPIRVFWALRTENWLHHFGEDNNRNRNRIKTQLLRAFYPDDAAWKAGVWKLGKQVVDQALHHF